MKVKTKLRLGFGFLFFIVLLFGAIALFYIHNVEQNSKVVLKDNYESLTYVREMRSIVDDGNITADRAARAKFNKYLTLEEHNITEPGERALVTRLRKAFESYAPAQESFVKLSEANTEMLHSLREIERVNMEAIVRKDINARNAIDHATFLLGITATFTFLVLFSFSVNFPGFIANPLRELLEGIREISEGNYRKRLHFEHRDEFAEVARAFNHMAGRLNDWENSNVATILSEKRRIEAIIEQMDDAIFGLDEKQNVLFINDAARRVLSIGDGNVVGRNTDELSKTNDLLRAVLQDRSAIGTFKVAIEGREMFFHLRSSDIMVPNLDRPGDEVRIASRPAGKVYLLRNITEFKERDEAKTNFIATISHELKTPISSIKMSLKLMRDDRVGQLNAEQRQLLEHVSDDSDRLLKITSELLELSQVETGNIQLNFVPVEPGDIADHAVRSIGFQAEHKGVRIEVRKDTKLPAVSADFEKTTWVLVNFLSNALRYSFEGSAVVVTVSHKGNEVEFAVTDTGKGIDEQYQKRLFDRYFQVPTDGQNRSGSGLGLAISKDFIEAQNGHIWLKSAIGEGSTFYFSLPAYRGLSATA